MAKYIGIADNINVLRRSYFQSEQICVLLQGEEPKYKRVNCVPKYIERFNVVVERLKSIDELNKKKLEPTKYYVFICDFKAPESFSNSKVHLLEYKKDFRARVHINLKRAVGHLAKITFPSVESIEVVNTPNIVMAPPNMIVTPPKAEPKKPEQPTPAPAPAPAPAPPAPPQPVAKVESKPVEEPKK